MASDRIVIRGAREHNLKNIDLEIPRDQLVVITGLSGSGKSSLAFDTIYAEGQRRYVESLSAYARQFLEQMEKPEVDSIEGLSPAISIEQKTTSKNPRSTVGTVTEIYDYLRVLFARIGVPHCPSCDRVIAAQTVQQMVDRVLAQPSGTRLLVLAPVIRGRKGEYKKLFFDLQRQGYSRVRVNGTIREVGEDIELDKKRKHTIEVVVDRLIVRENLGSRLADSLETALRLADGIVTVETVDGDGATSTSSRPPAAKAGLKDLGTTIKAGLKDLTTTTGPAHTFSEKLACAECGISFPEVSPRMFSFNNPYGACPECSGIGSREEIDPDRLVPNPARSLKDGALAPWAGRETTYFRQTLQVLAKRHRFSLETPWSELRKGVREVILHGERDGGFEGVVKTLERRYRETTSDEARSDIELFMTERACPACKGSRLRPESLGVKVGGRSIADVVRQTIKDAGTFFDALTLTERETAIARRVLKEIRERLGFLMNVGLDYLTLDRPAGTLSGGEGQRIRLATQIGSSLVGVLYILDEPSIGLHQRDNRRLLETLKRLRDLGNTVLVVEHDEETIRSADYVIDLGPGAGELGGHLVAVGTPDEIMANGDSLTGRYLARAMTIPVPATRRKGSGHFITIHNPREHNLKGMAVKIPLGTFTSVTGVSGSGKSTLVNDILYRALAQMLHRAQDRPGAHDRVEGAQRIDKVVDIDQSPIGRTPRSNPATYTGVFTFIRTLFARTPEARMRGYQPGRFSFNVKGGRCEACQGDGLVKIEMHFLPDVYVTCDVCKGRRYNRETLDVHYKGMSIAAVLDMTVREALAFFDAVPVIKSKLATLDDVGLDYIRLGQSATTLSGGEAQRVKLATELSRRATGKTLYILDEPTTGLHFADIQKLLEVLNKLVDQGNTVVIIEHNLDVVKTADWVIDLGPEGGDDGGRVVATGTPEELIRHPERTYTGQFLRPLLTGA
ncbi:MAG: excinuclease ABC subunit UvrA [Candidatus Rokuibacteriota bacterium]|nr:MAG: excinuclease ABC subunit UvrA [Candidatus Rokubacteria bacterium]PYN57900.1 MAG: excinuclease ABC subunit UvrA [Candidatus Rokubacteria bacterium]